jgi:hypothetical protein
MILGDARGSRRLLASPVNQSADLHPLNLASSCSAVKNIRSPRNRTLMEMAKGMRDGRGCNHVVCSQIFNVVSSPVVTNNILGLQHIRIIRLVRTSVGIGIGHGNEVGDEVEIVVVDGDVGARLGMDRQRRTRMIVVAGVVAEFGRDVDRVDGSLNERGFERVECDLGYGDGWEKIEHRLNVLRGQRHRRSSDRLEGFEVRRPVCAVGA